MSHEPSRRWLRRLAWGLAVLALLVGLTLAFLWRSDVSRSELEARYAPPPSQFVELEGQRLHYRDEGEGPPLLLIHGTAASLHTWDGWVEALRTEYRLIRLDLPGFGLSGPNDRGNYSTEFRLQVIETWLDHLGIERCHVAGNSLGGFLAWRLALRAPQRVDRLILIDAAGYPVDQEGGGKVLDLARTPVLKDVLVRLTPRFLVRRGLRQVYGDPSKVDAVTIDRYYDLLLLEGNRKALVQGLMQPSEDLSHRIPEIHQPTLIQWGREDGWIPLAVGERFRTDLPNSELRVYDGVGHVPMEEIPQLTAADALAFLQRVPPATPTAG